MSSLVRRIQKNIAKAQGFYRSTDKKEVPMPDGTVLEIEYKCIRNSDKKVVGTRWPQPKKG